MKNWRWFVSVGCMVMAQPSYAGCWNGSIECAVQTKESNRTYSCEAYLCSNVYETILGWDYPDGRSVYRKMTTESDEISVNGQKGVEIQAPESESCFAVQGSDEVYCGINLPI